MINTVDNLRRHSTFLDIRHGEGTHQADPDIIVGQAPWAELTLHGIMQAISCGLRLANQGTQSLWTYRDFLTPSDAQEAAEWYVSPLLRAQQTGAYALAAYICCQHAYLGDPIIHAVSALREQSLGSLEGTSRKAAAERYRKLDELSKGNADPSQPQRSKDAARTFRLAEGLPNPGQSMTDKGEELFKWVKRVTVRPGERGRSLAYLFGHGIAFRCMLAVMNGWDQNFMHVMRNYTSNTSITALRYTVDAATLMKRQAEVEEYRKRGLALREENFKPMDWRYNMNLMSEPQALPALKVARNNAYPLSYGSSCPEGPTSYLQLLEAVARNITIKPFAAADADAFTPWTETVPPMETHIPDETFMYLLRETTYPIQHR